MKRISAADVLESSLDEFTLTWLREHGAEECLNCGAWLTNEDGNETTMCLCGFCYCWACQTDALECRCGHDEFYDNAVDRDVYINRDDPCDHDIASGENLVDFRSFLDGRRSRRTTQHDDSSNASTVDNEEGSPVVEEATEVNFVTIFDYEEESAEAEFTSLWDWTLEEPAVPTMYEFVGASSQSPPRQTIRRAQSV